MRSLRHVLLLGALAVLAGCASGRGSGPAAPPRDLITRPEITAANVQTVYELVERLHPRWLRKRGDHGTDPGEDIVVYLDNARLGGPATLREIHVGGVMSVQFFDAGKAQYRFGPGHAHGAILVSTR